MLEQHREPIVAMATASGRGAVGIVRLSGSDLQALIRTLCGHALQPRHATHTTWRRADGSVIDQGLALYFAAPHSYTGEDVLELQAHGGPVVLQLLLARCLELAAETHDGGPARLPGLRLAEPGEFSLRAYLNGKLDLAQAEAVADLIDASTEAAARGAARALQGQFSQQAQALGEALFALRALVEATLDFPEEDIAFLQQGDARGQLASLLTMVTGLLQGARQGALLRDGVRVVIAGQPNVGKSSLLNALAGAELAIVTPIPGTTRDRLQQTIQIEGVPLHIIDTAGLRESDDAVERIGIARAWEAVADADVVLFVRDTRHRDATDSIAADAQLTSAIAQKRSKNSAWLEVWNKTDLAAPPPGALGIAAQTGAGLPALRQRLLELAGWRVQPEGVFSARARHVQALRQAQHHLQQAQDQLALDAPALELLAEDLRLAQRALQSLLGGEDVEALLGAIFSRFCIGK